MNGERRPTLSDQIRSALADAVSSGKLRAGTVLEEQQIADQCGVSRTPVREAIRQLQASGLVEAIGRRMVVARLTPTRIMEMFEAMAEIEAVCVRLATYRLTVLERSELIRLHEQTEALVEIDDVNHYDELNTAFHEALYYGTHNSFLIEQALSVRARLAAMRRMQLRKKGRLALSRGEHQDDIRAINEGDGEAAARRMRAHMLNAASALASSLRDQEGDA
jgi:DNA-binding GntR family transcriptional regulator